MILVLLLIFQIQKVSSSFCNKEIRSTLSLPCPTNNGCPFGFIKAPLIKDPLNQYATPSEDFYCIDTEYKDVNCPRNESSKMTLNESHIEMEMYINPYYDSKMAGSKKTSNSFLCGNCPFGTTFKDNKCIIDFDILGEGERLRNCGNGVKAVEQWKDLYSCKAGHDCKYPTGWLNIAFDTYAVRGYTYQCLNYYEDKYDSLDDYYGKQKQCGLDKMLISSVPSPDQLWVRRAQNSQVTLLDGHTSRTKQPPVMALVLIVRNI